MSKSKTDVRLQNGSQQYPAKTMHRHDKKIYVILAEVDFGTEGLVSSKDVNGLKIFNPNPAQSQQKKPSPTRGSFCH